MDTDLWIIANAIVMTTINVVILFVCTRVLHEVGNILKECAKCDIYKYVSEETNHYKAEDTDNIATELDEAESLPKQSLYRNKDGKLSYQVYNDNVKLRKSSAAHTIDFEEEFEHKPINSAKG